MKKLLKYFLFTLSFILVLSSPYIGYATLNRVFLNKNLAGEYDALLSGSINSYIILGILIFFIALADMILSRVKK